MRLAGLEPTFVVEATTTGFLPRTTCGLPEAQGLLFLCPLCWKRNGGPVGTHSILVWFADRNVPAECEPKPRWTATGTGLHDLTLAPSIDLSKGEAGCWHGFVQNGGIVGGI